MRPLTGVKLRDASRFSIDGEHYEDVVRRNAAQPKHRIERDRIIPPLVIVLRKPAQLDVGDFPLRGIGNEFVQLGAGSNFNSA